MKVLILGIFADEPFLGTGFSIVCSNLANYLSKKSDLKIIYFGRWGQEKYFRKKPLKTDFPYDYVPCQGGTWDKGLIDAIIRCYKIDILLTEDDWWSVDGFLYAVKSYKIPFHLITPIDALPINREAYNKFRQVNTLYIPNRSWEIIKMRDERINVKYFPHGCDSNIFKPIPEIKHEKITFIWSGRDEHRKNLRGAILAFEKICSKYDVELLIRTDWTMPSTMELRTYLTRKKLPIVHEQAMRGFHKDLAQTYNRGHVFLCTSKAGGFEIQPIEAMACGVPALITNWNFMNEHIVHGRNGFKIPYDNLEILPDGRTWANIDVNDLAMFMELCITNQKNISSMGQWARKYVEKKYKWEDSAEILYKSITMEN